MTPFLSIEDGQLTWKVGTTKTVVQSLDQLQALAAGGDFLVSSSVDFPHENTSDPRVIAMAQAIRGDNPFYMGPDTLHCPHCHAPLTLVTDGQVGVLMHPGNHVVSRGPLPWTMVNRPFLACSGCEYCVEVDTRTGALR